MYLTIREATEALGLSRWTVMRLIKRGDLEAFKTGHSRTSAVRISTTSVDAYIKANTQKNAKSGS